MSAPALRQAQRRQRVIVIGRVERKYVILRNAGYPHSLVMDWNGHVDWCQPWQFIQDKHCLSAIRTRLGMARLRLVELLDDFPEGHPPRDIRCVVERLQALPITSKHSASSATDL